MPRERHKLSYVVTVEDLSAVLREHAQEWQATAYLRLHLPTPTATSAYVDIALVEGYYTPAGRELGTWRYPLSAKHAERWPAEILYGLTMAYDQLRAQPWNWPAELRRRAAGE